MPGKRFKSQDSDQNQREQQKSRGSHFASSGAKGGRNNVPTAKEAPAPQVKSVRLPQVAAESNRSITEQSKPGKKISPLDSSMIPRIASQSDPDSTGHRRAVITGASGVFAKVGGKPARKVTGENKAYSRYSNGYFDRPDAKQLSDVVAQFQTEPIEGAPAYGWTPFIIYGAVAALASIAWLALVMITGMTPIHGATKGMMIGLFVLAGIVVAGLLFTAITATMTMKMGQFEKRDVVASALGKTALMMLAALVVWVICCAIAG